MMRRKILCSLHAVTGVGLLTPTLLLGTGLFAGGSINLALAPVIRHEAIERMPNNHFPQVQAVIQSEAGIKSAKLYFRGAQYPDFYYVDMIREGNTDTFTGVLPTPEEGTDVAYYIEAVDVTFDSFRTEEYESETTDEPVAAIFLGNDPGIVVGKVIATSPDTPPGFKRIGIRGVLGARGEFIALGAVAGGAGVGLAAGGGGGGGTGMGVTTVTAIGAAAAAGGTAGFLASRGDATPETSDASALTACFNTSVVAGPISAVPASANLEEGQIIELDGRCSEPADSITLYQWDLGDGRMREGPRIRAEFPRPSSDPLNAAQTYNIALRISDGTNFSTTAPLMLTVRPDRRGPGAGGEDRPNRPPLACFETTPDPPEIAVGGSITLDARCSLADRSGGLNDAIESYQWDLGDGRSREGAFITPVYSEPGDFVVTLTVIDSQGNQDSTTDQVTVTNDPPLACFETTPDPPEIEEGESIQFDARCSLADQGEGPNDEITLYQWELGDGTSRDGARITPTYSAPGDYTVRLTVTDSHGDQDSTSQRVTVNPASIDLSIDLTEFIPIPLRVDEPFDYEVRVRNPGPEVSATLAVSLSGPLDFSGASFGNPILNGACDPPASSFTCTGNASGTQTIVLQNIVPTAPGPVTATATISSGNPDPDPGNNSHTALADVQPVGADLRLSTSVLTNVPNLPLELEATVENIGDLEAEGVVLTTTLSGIALGLGDVDYKTEDFSNCNTTTLMSSVVLTCNKSFLSAGGLIKLGITVDWSDAGTLSIQSAVALTPPPPDTNLTNNSVSDTVFVGEPPVLRTLDSRRPPDPRRSPVETSFSSHLDVPPGDGNVRARVRLNESRVVSTNNSVPFRHPLRGRPGENTVEGHLVRRAAREGRWRFDFSGASHFEHGSIRVTQGQVLSMNATSVVFRLSGAPGERVQFTYRLSP